MCSILLSLIKSQLDWLILSTLFNGFVPLTVDRIQYAHTLHWWKKIRIALLPESPVIMINAFKRCESWDVGVWLLLLKEVKDGLPTLIWLQYFRHFDPDLDEDDNFDIDIESTNHISLSSNESDNDNSVNEKSDSDNDSLSISGLSKFRPTTMTQPLYVAGERVPWTLISDERVILNKMLFCINRLLCHQSIKDLILCLVMCIFGGCVGFVFFLPYTLWKSRISMPLHDFREYFFYPTSANYTFLEWYFFFFIWIESKKRNINYLYEGSQVIGFSNCGTIL